MKREAVSLEELYRLLPPLEELEGLRLSVVGTSVPDPGKEWASSSAYTTVDKRIVVPNALEEVLREAEDSMHRHVSRVFSTFGEFYRSFWSGNDAEAAGYLIQLGDQEHADGRYLRARHLFETALSVCLPLPDKQPQISALRRIARTLVHLGDLREAMRYYNRSAELARDTGDLRSEVIARTGTANVLALQGRWQEAEIQYRAILDKLDEADGDELLLERAQLYNNLGTVAARQNRADEAEEWFARALDLWQTRESPVDLAICFHSQGLLRQQQGRQSEAREIFEKALAYDIPPGPGSVLATDLAACYAEDGMLTQATQWGREAEKLAIAARSPYFLSHMYRGLGNIARRKKDEGGVTFFEKALEIARTAELPFAEGETLVDYASLRSQIGEKEEAFSYLQRAKEIFTSLGAVHELARAEQLSEEIRNTEPPPIAVPSHP